MEQAELLTELKRLFDNTRNIDEFEFVNVLISFNGMGDQRALTHLYESRAYIADMKARYLIAETPHSKSRLGLHIYCHIFEMDELYNILGNLLRIAANQQLRYLPDLYNGRDVYFTPSEKFHKLLVLVKQSRFEHLITGLDSLYLNEVRNAFVHSAYSLIDDDFCLVRGNGIPINGTKHQSVSITQFLLPLVERAIDFIEQFFSLIDENKMSYTGIKLVQARMPDLQPVMILGDSKTGLIGFQTFVGSWIKIQPSYSSDQFVQAMNLRIDSKGQTPELNERLEAYIDRLTPHGKDFFTIRDEVLASGDAYLLKNLAMVYFNHGNNTASSRNGKPLRQQESILNSAIERYDLALSIDPNFSRAYHNKGTAMINLAQLKDDYNLAVKQEVLALFDKTLAIDPNMYEAWLNSGRVLADINNYETDKEKQLAGLYESVNRYQKSIAIYPHDHSAYENLGWLYRRLAHLTTDNEQLFKEGISAYEMAAKLQPGLESALALATMIGEYGESNDTNAEEKTKEAIHQLEKAKEKYGNSADLNYRLANKYAQLGKLLQDKEVLKIAVKLYDEAIQLDATHVQAMNNAAHVELELSLYEENCDAAIQQLEPIAEKLERLLRLDPNHENGWYNLGLLHLELAKRNGGKDTQALLESGIEELMKAETFKPDYATFDIARGYALMGNKTESLKWLEQWMAKAKNGWENASFKEDFKNLMEDDDFKKLTAG